MAAKLLHSLADDNPDLQRQIGCMTGILQIFDRQSVGRHLSQKRLLPPGSAQYSNASHDVESSTSCNQEPMENVGNKNINDKQMPTELSRASFSSASRSSSFSSLDCGRLGRPDPSSLDRMIFPETPSRDPVITQPSASPKMGRLSLDLRDVVKDSMYRESRVTPVQFSTKEDGSGCVSKPKDSPRPFQLSKTVHESLRPTTNRKNDLPVDLRGSFNDFSEFHDVPWQYIEKHARLSYETENGSSRLIAMDAPKHSYDGWETNHPSFEPRDFSKSNRRLSDLPRLSLDGRESSTSTRASNYESNLAYLSANVQNGDENVMNTKQSSRSHSVVAKLMGLETLSYDKPCVDRRLGPIKTVSAEDYDTHSVTSNKSDRYRPIRLPVSPRSSKKEPTSPRWRNTEMKPISSSKCPMEPAPWKYTEGNHIPQQQLARQPKSTETAPKSSPSVYGEIEKRLKDLEFKQSGKDLRALKQIMEAMQANGILGMPKEDKNSNEGSRREEKQPCTSPNTNYSFSSENKGRKNHTGPSSKPYESPIVIMKPAKLVKKSGLPPSSLIPINDLSDLQSHGSNIARHGKLSLNRRSGTDQSSKESQTETAATSSADRKSNNRSLGEAQNSVRSLRTSKDNSVSPSKSTGSVSPRMQKKLDFDKRSRPPTPPDTIKSRRRSNHQLNESGGSRGGRRKTKPSITQQNADRLSDGSSDVEVTSNERSVEVNQCQVLHESLKHIDDGETKMSSSNNPIDDEIKFEHPIAAVEHQSPVSVLDDSAYREDSPPPVNQTSHGLEENGRGQRNPLDELNPSNYNHRSALSKNMNRNKLQSIDKLVEKLTRLNSTHDEEHTDYIASLCENSTPNDRYISEILLASGILLSSGPDSLHLHPSGHLINPQLFMVLEQTKSATTLLQDKLHRKLLFDTANEILTGKFQSWAQDSEPLKPAKLARKSLDAQKLLRQVCAEIEQLRACGRRTEDADDEKAVLWEDVMHRSGDGWTDFNGMIPSVVLDAERSIFKDLVDEVVVGFAARLPARRRRQRLFSK